MTNPTPLIADGENAAGALPLPAAIAESDANPCKAPHEEVRAWLLRLARGGSSTFRLPSRVKHYRLFGGRSWSAG